MLEIKHLILVVYLIPREVYNIFVILGAFDVVDINTRLPFFLSSKCLMQKKEELCSK